MSLVTKTATIPAGQSLSGAIDCSAGRIVRIVTPPTWTAAPLTFQASVDGVNFQNLYRVQDTQGTFTPFEVVLPIVPVKSSLVLPATTGYTVNFIKLRSGTAALPVTQAGDRAFSLILEETEAAGGGAAGPTGPAGPAGTSGTTGATGPTGTASSKGTVAGDEAAAGNVGEVISSSNAGGLALTTAVTINVTQIALTPGDWNVGGVVIFTPVGTGPNSVIAALSPTSATLPTDNDVATGKAIMAQIWASSMPAGKTQTTPTSLIRINTSTPKTVYLVAQATFGGGSVTCAGYVSARRIR